MVEPSVPLDLEASTESVGAAVEFTERQIIFRNEHFLIINKPFDVRMNGEFTLTVDKLVESWLASDIKVNFIHNLDFATSGILSGGFTREGTSWGASLLNDRSASKVYISVILGHVTSEFLHNIPIMDDFHAFDNIVNGRHVSEDLNLPSLYRSSSLVVHAKINECLSRYFAHSDSVNHYQTNIISNHLILNGSIQEKTDSFHVKLSSDRSVSRGAYTVLIPLSTCNLLGMCVTKVLLLPFTGRRHQLRIHTSGILNMHIVGDYSYGGAVNIEGQPTREFDRMLLHAQFLFLPFSKKSVKSRLFDNVPVERSDEVKVVGLLSDISGSAGLSIKTIDPFSFIT